MRLPRAVSGDDLIAGLQRLGYEPTRQSGSHVRLTRQFRGEAQHMTVPHHGSLRVGTLNSILREVSIQLDIEKDELAKRLFSK